jgi:hypothetical protein
MKSRSRFIEFGVALGAAIGAIAGVATHQLNVWMLLGIGVGLAVGVALRDRKQAACRMNETERKSLQS